MKFDLHKLLRNSLIIIATLGITVGSLNGTVSAKRHPYHIHRVYRHHNLRRSRKSKNYRKTRRGHKRTKKFTYHKRSNRHGLAKYIYYVRNKKEIKNAEENEPEYTHMTMRKFYRKYVRHGVMKAYDIWGAFSPVSDVHKLAKETHIPFAKMVTNGGNYGPVKSYYLNGGPSYFSKNGLTQEAHADGLTVHQYLHKYLNTRIDGTSIYGPDYSYDQAGHNDNESTNNEGHVNENKPLIENKIQSQTINDLSQDRASIGEQPQQECSDLDATAKERSQELVTDFSHENANGQYADDEDGNIDSENIAYETEPNGTNSDDIANKAANDLNHMLFYDEEPSDGIHYEDIKDHSQVGVGATIANGNVYLAEDFAE